MLTHLVLAVGLALSPHTTTTTSIVAVAANCTITQIAANQCPPALHVDNQGGSIDVGTTIDFGSAGGAPENSGGGPGPIGHYPSPPDPGTPPPPPDESDGPIVCLDDTNTVIGPECTIGIPEPTEEEPEPDEPAAPPAVVTLTDLASFVPAPPAVTTEPDGIGAKNMPLNTIATSSAQTIGGELFGFPVSVTFTPAGFRQDWGDGTVTESRTGGAAWEALGQPEFSPTDTSHAYAEKGTYTLTVTALYTAAVDFGEWGTRTVDGVISAPSAARDIRIVEVHTALVQQDCIDNPDGAGCS
ncbi:hypothetical protein [Microbacterium sp. JZ31]|uniref:hypothetical protein n=1 Tax=Microbacterium sp. JZ31 TaxID=1906274 RepID=UPI0019331E82|nr:hypothetical protein [Microbacterium sp. JZ31]